VKIKGTEKIDFKKDVYIYQEDFNPVAVQENKKGNIEIDVSDIFENHQKWKWGIKTKKYYSAILTAIAFKKPSLNMTVPNVLISIESKDELHYITAVVFDENESEALNNAFKFKTDNRDLIVFEISAEYKKYPIKAEKDDLLNLIADIHREIKEVKEITAKTFEETKKHGELSGVILNEIKNIKDMMSKTIPYLVQKVEELEKKISSNSDSYQVELLDEKGVYVNGEKIYLELLGQVFDYLEPDVKSFLSFYGFRTKELSNIKQKLHQTAKDKFLQGENTISFQEAVKISGMTTKNRNSWRIILQIKDETFKEAVKVLKRTTNINAGRIEELFRKAIEQNISEGKNAVSLEDLEKFANEEEVKSLKNLKENVSSILKGKKDFDVGNKAVVVADGENKDLVLHALTLEVKRRTGKKLTIRGV